MFGSKAFNKFVNNQVIVSWCAVEKLSGYVTGLVTQQLGSQYFVFLFQKLISDSIFSKHVHSDKKFKHWLQWSLLLTKLLKEDLCGLMQKHCKVVFFFMEGDCGLNSCQNMKSLWTEHAPLIRSCWVYGGCIGLEKSCYVKTVFCHELWIINSKLWKGVVIFKRKSSWHGSSLWYVGHCVKAWNSVLQTSSLN